MSKRTIQHGLWKKYYAMNRRTKKYIPMPLKIRDLLQKKADKFDLEVVEFTYGTVPEKSIAVIAIVHKLDHFRKRAGSSIVKQRLDWAEDMTDEGKTINHKAWAYGLGK